ncbi:ABC transporter ATP-binding protein [Anaerosacchariphilus polymeriproducens]|uniref:ABC transporter ATP-binding protein n=1 Tax=Anaerosacchariphilus polymeriproducens TaxID=1812858 RepID=A0A371ARC9_9FIRM|nr:ABC transporter ATP-binding protein [Anaerosacchariphilus polymeriproducens]RDU22137.1 ABC transporter ATP-binding protein [Anaerosacchariphilus polymeriproducens]
MEKTVIKVEHLSKIYKLYQKPSDRLKESLGFTRKKKYQEHKALNDVNIEIKKGETIGIIGTNGSGKSTLLKIITGVLNPTSGNVIIDGRISALLELGAGFNMEYTGIENVYMNGMMIGFSREEVDEKLNDILEFADIGDFVYQPVKTYSSGMFVRLAFAVAINIEPEILIVDEALSVGDVFFQAKCYRKFEEFKKMGRTILFVSHDLSSISRYCDRVILLNKGIKTAEGDPKEMIDIYKKVLVNQYDEEKELMTPVDEKAFAEDSWARKLLNNQRRQEYGTKLAEIIDYGIMDQAGTITNNIMKGEPFTVKMKVIFHELVQDPIFAFSIKDMKGTEITGTNTMVEKKFVNLKEKEQVIEISFEQNMDLQGGEYLLSLGCTGYERENFTVYHRLYDICSITVIADKNSVGFYDMNSKIQIV